MVWHATPAGDRRRYRLGHLDRAERHLAESLEMARSQDAGALVAGTLAALAGPLADREDARTAARLIGASEAIFERLHDSHQPADVGDYSRIELRVRDVLSPEAFEEEVREGRLLDEDEAVDLARSRLAAREIGSRSPG